MQPPKLNLDITKSTEVVCEKCQCKFFKEKMIIRKFSKLVIGASQDQIIPIPVICCYDCNHINTEFEPKI